MTGRARVEAGKAGRSQAHEEPQNLIQDIHLSPRVPVQRRSFCCNDWSRGTLLYAGIRSIDVGGSSFTDELRTLHFPGSREAMMMKLVTVTGMGSCWHLCKR
ncbi:uncharacterized protein LOC143671050 [Tamandua tetradactyla]|uniref:uncharacterized protein LOC143671050 n=1 Tax=Tamandua tetradactyla TaxID=48850 RepID=UPI0040548F4B